MDRYTLSYWGDSVNIRDIGNTPDTAAADRVAAQKKPAEPVRTQEEKPIQAEQIEQAKLDKWYITRPAHVMTAWEEIKLFEESIDWFEKLWLEDEQVRKTISPEEWKEFINALYDWLAQLEEQSTK